ncbi:MAG: hypothetical protein WEK74_13685 [Hydrogenophaga sp.]
MFSSPEHREIDHRTLKLTVGVIAISLACLTSVFADSALASISESYHSGGWSQTIFIGFLFAISAFLLAYNGMSRSEMLLSKLAAIAGLGIALFPCRCGSHPELLPNVHAVSAATMFLILAYFCYGFFNRARQKGHPEARLRAAVYAVCGVAIVSSILVLAMDALFGGFIVATVPRLTFYGEATALIAFGISWLTASRTLPVLTREGERFSPMRQHNPE